MDPRIPFFLLPVGFQMVFFKATEVYWNFSFMKDGLGDFPMSCAKWWSQARSVGSSQPVSFSQQGKAFCFNQWQTGIPQAWSQL